MSRMESLNATEKPRGGGRALRLLFSGIIFGSLLLALPSASAKEPPDRLTITQNSTGRSVVLREANLIGDAWMATFPGAHWLDGGPNFDPMNGYTLQFAWTRGGSMVQMVYFQPGVGGDSSAEVGWVFAKWDGGDHWLRLDTSTTAYMDG